MLALKSDKVALFLSTSWGHLQFEIKHTFIGNTSSSAQCSTDEAFILSAMSLI